MVVSSRARRDTGRVNAGPSRSAPATAPGRLEVVQRFLNTLHVERGTDGLDSPSTAYTWMAGAAPSPLPPPGPEDLDRLRTRAGNSGEMRRRPLDDEALTLWPPAPPLRLGR